MFVYLNEFSHKCEYLLGKGIKSCSDHPSRATFLLFIIAVLNLLKTHEMTHENPQALLCLSVPDFSACPHVIITYRNKQKTCKA